MSARFIVGTWILIMQTSCGDILCERPKCDLFTLAKTFACLTIMLEGYLILLML